MPSCTKLGHDKDATAFNPDQNEICLSSDRLLEKLHYSNAVTELIAIAVHELTHRMNALHFVSRPIYRAGGGIFADFLKSSSELEVGSSLA